MKLSEAIMLGSAISKQGQGPDSLHGDDRCAIGAALQALGVTNVKYGEGYAYIYSNYPKLSALHPECPAGKCKIPQFPNADAVSTIWHLNDIHEWTREQIAEWVATIEPPETEPKREVTPGFTASSFDYALAQAGRSYELLNRTIISGR